VLRGNHGVLRGCYNDAIATYRPSQYVKMVWHVANMSATSRACRARRIWKTIWQTDKQAALLQPANLVTQMLSHATGRSEQLPVIPHVVWQVSVAISVDVLVANQTCGQPAVEPYVSLTHIVGGVEARKHSWPWMCLISVYGNSVCGGSVIDSRHILTAAHCL